MKKAPLLLTAIAILGLSSCKEEPKTPKVIYENPKVQAKTAVVDSSQIQIADLPILMQGTNFLIHPIGKLQVVTKSTKTSFESGSSQAGENFRISNNDENELTGFLTNLKFQQIGTDSIKALTDKPVLIQTATYLKSVADKTKQHILIYTLADMDTNKDGIVNANDIKSLYASDISGNKFTKLSSDFQELIDWNLIDATNHLYFRTIEDTNKNGQFDKSDVIHYHFIDLTNKEWNVQNYNPN